MIALFVIMWSIDHIVTRNLWQSKVQMLDRYNTVYGDTVNYDVLIMGSSRGMVQYSPEILDSILGVNSYNISCNGRCIDAEVNIFNAYCRNHSLPPIIIQNIDHGTLHMSNMYEREQYLPYIIHDKKLFNATKETEQFGWSDYLIPLKRYAGYHEMIKEGLHIRNKMYKPYNEYKGFEGRDWMWDGSVFRTISKEHFVTNPQADTIFDHYLAFCQAKSIQVIFVYAPLYYGLTEKLEADTAKMFEHFQYYANKYHCPILNYLNDSICYDTLNFYNANHLNQYGAEQFSTKLAHDLKELLQ